MKYEIKGDTLPVVVCQLEAGEAMITEKGSMSWMSPNMQMETTGKSGGGKALGRMFAGDSFFQNVFKAQGGNGLIAFSASFPGTIKAFEISADNEMVCQKGTFLAGEEGVQLSIHFNKKVGTGLFGGEGFIMQKISGEGVALCEFNGTLVEYELQAGQQVVVATGHLAAMTASCHMDIQTVKGMKNKLLGGEGFFNTVVTGPGRVWLQTMSIADLAHLLRPYMPSGD